MKGHKRQTPREFPWNKIKHPPLQHRAKAYAKAAGKDQPDKMPLS
ncbi:MAG TPA: hypothetical protein VIL86_15370 [Tepidisphaeraceae bacterium]